MLKCITWKQTVQNNNYYPSSGFPMKRLVNFEPAPWTYRAEDTWADNICAQLIIQVLKHQDFGRNTVCYFKNKLHAKIQTKK